LMFVLLFVFLFSTSEYPATLVLPCPIIMLSRLVLTCLPLQCCVTRQKAVSVLLLWISRS
jgi:hypothetical protein